MHVGTDFLKLPPVTGQYWSLFQCSMLGTGGTCDGRGGGAYACMVSGTPGTRPTPARGSNTTSHGHPPCVLPYMVQCGPTDGPHLPGIDMEQLSMKEEHGEVQVGIAVELQKGACQFRLQDHGSPGDRVPKPETEGEHSGVLGVRCLFQRVGERACPRCEMEVRSGVGGQIVPDRGPQAAGVGETRVT